MIEIILKILFGGSDVIMALPPAIIAALISAGVGVATTVGGAISESQKRKKMAAEREKWDRENDAWYNSRYSSDYLLRADAQSIIRSMREQMNEQNKNIRNTSVITGATEGAQAAALERSQKLMGNIYSNLAAQGQRWKDSIDSQYRNRRYGIQGLEYDTMNQQAQSANNLMYNGIKGLAETNWADIVGGSS